MLIKKRRKSRKFRRSKNFRYLKKIAKSPSAFQSNYKFYGAGAPKPLNLWTGNIHVTLELTTFSRTEFSIWKLSQDKDFI